MNRLTLAILCVLACVGAASAQTSAPAPNDLVKEREARAEALRVASVWLDSVQVYQHIPSISAGVGHRRRPCLVRGFGTIDAAHSVPASAQTIYSICSISKLFTSISLMQLVESGKVRLDDPITTYLPWATIQAAPDSGPITLRGLLTHSAGIPREADFPYWSGPDYPFPTHDQIKSTIATQTALYPAERYFSTAISASPWSARPLKLSPASPTRITPRPTSHPARPCQHPHHYARGPLRQATRRGLRRS